VKWAAYNVIKTLAEIPGVIMFTRHNTVHVKTLSMSSFTGPVTHSSEVAQPVKMCARTGCWHCWQPSLVGSNI